MSGLGLDVHQAARGLWKARGLSAVVVLTLALGSGAATTMFSVLHASLFRPPPFPDPDRLVIVGLTVREPGQPERRTTLPNQAYEFVRDRATSLQGVAAFTNPNFNVTGYDQSERVLGEVVSANYFNVLGVSPVAGRGFAPGEDSVQGASPVVVISHALWRRRFAGDPAIVGKRLSLNRVPLAVIGVMPREFQGVSGNAQLWITRAMAPVVAFPYAAFSVVGRLRESATLARAQAELALLGSRIASDSVPRSATATPLAEARVDIAGRTPLWILFGAVGVLLLIACANIANLLLVRAQSREREIAVRLALGTSRGRLVRFLLTESALLGIAGGLAGLVVAWISIRALGSILPPRPFVRGPFGAVGGFAAPGLDLTVLGFTWGVIAVTTLAFGLVPVLGASRTQPAESLKSGGRATSRVDVYALLAVGEIAMAVILLAGSGLLLRSLWRLENLPLGFEPRGLITSQIQAPLQWYRSTGAAELVERLVNGAKTVPGVEVAAASYYTPFDGGARHQVRLVGSRDAELWGGRQYVTPEYFDALRIPLRAGRKFNPQDRAGRPLVAIVSEAAALRFWPGENPIGKRFFIGVGRGAPPDSAVEVVGVAGDVQRRPTQYVAEPDVYTPYYQFVTNVWALLMVRSSIPEARLVPALRSAVSAVDPDLPLSEVQSMDQRGGAQLTSRRLNAILLTVFAALALVIATVGVYGVIAHQSAQRTREYGIRIALGAGRRAVLGIVFRRAATLIAAGLTLGVAGGLILSRLLATQLYQVRSTDPLTFVTICAVLAAATLAATWLPARRAARVEPVNALREE